MTLSDLPLRGLPYAAAAQPRVFGGITIGLECEYALPSLAGCTQVQWLGFCTRSTDVEPTE